MLSSSVASLSFFTQLESPRWIILLVSIVGVFLAYMTDEGFLLFQRNEFDTWGTKPSTCYKSTSQKLNKLSGLHSTYFTGFYDGLPTLHYVILDFLTHLVQTIKTKIHLYQNAFYAKRHAKTKKQFVYIMLKQKLNIPVLPNETEIDSYLDCKEHLGSRWPFMWEVSNVKDKKIQCSSYTCVPMSSYSYLDLLRDERIQNAAMQAAQEWSTGNHGPRMLGGNTSIIRQLEKRVAQFFGRDDALICTTGYLACMSAAALVCGENAVVFADCLIHASLRAGLKLGEGKVVLFSHNNMEDCEKRIQKYRHKYSSAWIIVESVYSMDGDIPDLRELHRLCQQYKMSLMIDEAHGLGVLGKTGRGLEDHFNMPGVASLIVGTFSKSIASIGGFITGPKRYLSYISDQALGSLFSAPLPGYCAGAALKSFEVITKEPQLVQKAQKNSKLLRQRLRSKDYWPENYPEANKFCVKGSDETSVIPVIFPNDLNRVLRVATAMKEKGFMCSAVGYPACSLSTPRFRITATSAYDEKLIETFVKAFVETCVEIGPSD